MIWDKLRRVSYQQAFFICGILFFSMTTTWQNLPKNGTDNETIEQAISRLITVHNNDNTSHLAEGQSIDEHRKETILDHPAGSIMGDKYSNRDFTVIPTFESLDAYTKSSAGISRSLGGLRFETTATSNTVRYLRAGGQYSPRYYKEIYEIVFQYSYTHNQGTNYLAYGVVGGSGNIDVGAGVGFKFLNNAIYAVQIYQDSGYNLVENATLISGAQANLPHVFRVHLSAQEEVINYYIDATLVHSESIEQSYDYGLDLFEFYLKNTNATIARGTFSGVYLSINVLDYQ